MRTMLPGRFNLIRVLGENSYAKSYLASDLSSDEANVLVKIFRKRYFVDERAEVERVLSTFMDLRYQHVAPILEAGLTHSGDLYLIRDFFTQPAVGRDTQHIRQLLSAIMFLNSRGYVHGSIKPSNIWLSDIGLKLSDPKISRSIPSDSSIEEIRFNAPEVLKGAKPSTESDLYSVGALLYRWVVGQDPFEDSEMNVLKLKYLWALPQPVAERTDGFHSVADAILGLLNKDPQRRPQALNVLSRIFRPKELSASRSLFLGRTEELQELRNTILHRSPKTLRVVVIEGTPGIGKSRCLEQLRVACTLDPVSIAVCRCGHDVSLQPIISEIRRLVQWFKGPRPGDDKFEPFLNALSGFAQDDELEPSPSVYPLERITSDLVSVLSILARSGRIAFVIDDIDQAHPGVIKFVEQLCLRATEVPIVLVLTCRALSEEKRLAMVLGDVLRGDFGNLLLTPLDSNEIKELLVSSTGTKLDHSAVLRACGGNPLFLQEYVTGLSSRSRIQKAVDCIVSSVSEQEKAVVETLALFDESSPAEVIARICDQDATTVVSTLSRLQRRGVIVLAENGPSLHPAVKARIRRSIAPGRWIQLNKTIFGVLNTTSHSIEELARWAHEGQLFGEAALLYAAIASQYFEKHNFKHAAFSFEQMEYCCRRAGMKLSWREKARQARCYQHIGKVSKARKLYEDLMRSPSEADDKESLSTVYSNLSSIFDGTKASIRIALSRKAIDLLPENSPSISASYARLCCEFLKTGDLPAAKKALENAERGNKETAPGIIAAKASLLLNEGNFEAALDSFKALKGANFDQRAISLNMGLCFEHLGELTKARLLFEKAEESSFEAGHVPIYVLSVLNLGCVAMKYGDLAAAQQYYEEALARLERVGKAVPGFDRNNFMSVYADTAAYRMETGDFKGAGQLIRNLRPNRGWVFSFNRIHCELLICQFFGKMGRQREVEAKLAALGANDLFSSAFFQIQKDLLKAGMNDADPTKTFHALTDALAATEMLKTLYMQCDVLNALSRTSIKIGDRNAGLSFANRAQALARRRHYRLLGARALLYAGMASEVDAQKQRYLYSAFQEASEMGLRELVAESAFEIGSFQLSRKNWVTAQEYLMRSISVLEEIAEGIPEKYRAGYLSGGPHRKALQALKVCNPEVQKLLSIRSSGPDFGSEKRYFGALYQLTAAGGSAPTAEGIVTSIANALEAAVSRAAVVTVKHGNRHISRALKTKQAEELISRAEKLIGKTKDRIYLAAADAAPHRPVAWVSFECPGWEGGVYVVCGPHENTFAEREIEFLTMVGAIGSSSLSALESRKRDEVYKPSSEFHGMIGSSKAIHGIFSQIQVAAANTATVLIEGESGTGKELVAKAIHSESARAKGPFIAVDCGAFPESLIEAELFGAKKGSYTGAVSDRPGLFEAAHGGTIFLDEISNTPLALQAKLLRVIQEREVRRIGETKGRSVDVRLVAASNQSLESMAEAGQFRKDLLYRLKVLHIKLPPLRARRDDIPLLARAFLQKLNIANKTKKYFDPEVMNRLSTCNFPGNVRELQNAIERAFFSTKGSAIRNVPLESVTPQDIGGSEEVQSWFKDLSEGRKDFWNAVHNRYKRRDISREKVLALIDFGLRSTRGNYKAMAGRLRLKNKDYRRFMDFLRRSDCLLDFRPYRKMDADGES